MTMDLASFARRAVKLAAVVAAGFGLMFTSIGPAAAHAVIVDTDPPEGQVLDAAPAKLTLNFNEPVYLNDGGIVVLDASGAELEVSASAADSTVTVNMPPEVPNGTYIVSWRVVSDDTHSVKGAFTFSVGEASDISATALPDDSSSGLTIAKMVLQGVSYLGIFVAVGLTLFELLFLAGGADGFPQLRRSMRTVIRVGAGAAALALVLVLPVTAVEQSGEAFGAVFSGTAFAQGAQSTSGLASALGLVGLIILTVLGGRRAGMRRWSRALVFAGVGVVLGSLVLVGHTRTFGPAALMLTSDVVHVIAGSVWFGGLLGIVLILAPRAGVPAATGARTVARFSGAAAWLLGAVGLSGVLLGWRILGSFGPLFSTWYGRTLLLKVLLVGLVVLAAAWNRFRLVPTIEAHGDGGLPVLRRVVLFEGVFLAVVLLVTGVLVSQSPVVASSESEIADKPIVAQAPLGDGRIWARVTPGRTGTNSVELTMLGADGEVLELIEDPVVDFAMPDVGIGPLEREVAKTGPGKYEATIEMPLPGDWAITVSARVSKYENPVAVIPLEVVP